MDFLLFGGAYDPAGAMAGSVALFALESRSP
jgi:hypothetical protein